MSDDTFDRQPLTPDGHGDDPPTILVILKETLEPEDSGIPLPMRGARCRRSSLNGEGTEDIWVVLTYPVVDDKFVALRVWPDAGFKTTEGYVYQYRQMGELPPIGNKYDVLYRNADSYRLIWGPMKVQR